ncbi:type II secretion system minor pseudopilin GspK [Microbulbifer guangxiensis]|uniref:type II secretion system minor pseudopilin GspK n=1 Tax=Microbulbifer guangxiensis TaxID=2904249 RepID=UPI001F019CE3|nr:type II secretion system minor pseudopilin GspK [Microbulbifer guangxiensis]
MSARHAPRRLGHQRGVALVTVLLLLVVAVAALTHTITRNRIAVTRTAALLANAQLAEFVGGAEAWARIALQRDYEQDKEQPDSADTALEAWAVPALSFNPDNGKIRINIKELNSCFNVNNLTETAGQSEQGQIFERLVRNVTGKSDLARAIQDWVDAGDTPLAPGTEDDGYLGRELAHRTPDAPITDISELAAVTGMEAEDWEALRPHLCALPETGTAINVNFASPELLSAIAPQSRANEVESFRDADGVFTERSQLEAYGLNAAPGLVFHSRYFLARIAVQLGEQGDHRQYWESLLQLDERRGEVRVVQRQRRPFAVGQMAQLLDETASEVSKISN